MLGFFKQERMNKISKPLSSSDNNVEEHVDDLIEITPEVSPDENVAIVDEDTVKPGPEVEHMEVHHHGHNHGHQNGKRHWKSYCWEFLMLFLAVFCGFLAEYQLEHKIETDRELDYINTMIADLQSDNTQLSSAILVFKQKGIELDSLLVLLNSANVKDNGADLYYYGREASRFDFFTSTDPTIQQMKNSGAFRLIKNKEVAYSILQYYSEMNALYLLQNNANKLSMEYRSISYNLFDPAIYETMVNDKTKNVIMKPSGNPSLVSYDKSAVRSVSSVLHYMKGTRLILHDKYIYVRNKSTELSELLKKEYILE